MRFRALFTAALALIPAAALAGSMTLLGAGSNNSISPGTPKSLTITSSIWTSPTDLSPLSQFVNGWTGDLVLANTTDAGNTAAYAFGSYPSTQKLSFTATRPGFDSTGTATTVADTIYATSWLRQTYSNYTLPTEAQTGTGNADAKIALTLSDFAYASDSLSSATTLSGLYISGAVTSTAASGIPVTNNSTKVYPPPIGKWITDPGQRFDGSATQKVEFFAGQAYGQGGVPVAAVKVTLTDGTHSVSHTVSTMTESTRQLSTTCTATNGSNVLTGCGSTVGFIVGERITVPGVPGQPKILSIDSSSQMTLGVQTTCTPTVLGNETCSATPGHGEALADGAFVGQNIADAHLTTNPSKVVAPVGTGATVGSTTTITLGAPASGQWAAGEWITGTNIPANDYIASLGTSTGGAGTATLGIASTGTVSGNVTGSAIGANPAGTTVTTVHISTSSATATASSGTVTFRHDYQGSTGTVTVTSGAPTPVYSASFTSSDFSTMTDGVVWFRAQVYPVKGDQVLDTQTGADGTRCDWFYLNVNGGVCNSSSAAWFNVNGTDISPNLHNLWAYLDAGGNYAPVYAWVSGTAGGSPAVSTSSADPGSTAYYASVSTAVTALKAYYNSHNSVHHNDLNGGVVCVLAAGSPYSGFGGQIDTSGTTNNPPFTITSVLTGQACPATGSANSDVQNVNFTHNATTNNLLLPTNARINNLKIADASQVFQGSDSTGNTTMMSTEIVFNNDLFVSSSSLLLYKIGHPIYYNNLMDESQAEGNLLIPFSVRMGADAFFNTIYAAQLATQKSKDWLFGSLGNIAWGLSVISPTGAAVANYNVQPLSTVVAYNKFMGSMTPVALLAGMGEAASVQNVLDVNNVIECINTVGATPCKQISADNVNTNLTNYVGTGNTVMGARTNLQYLEGVPSANGTLVGSGGTFAGGQTLNMQFGYALKANPTVVTSTDGVTSNTFAPVANGSISIVLPCDANYVFYIYLGTANPPGTYATVGGVDAKALAGCQTVIATALGSAVSPPVINVGGITGHNEQKFGNFYRFNLDQNFNMKTDTYNGSGSINSGGRVGNWEGRWRTGWMGNVSVTGSVIVGGVSPLSGLAETLAYLDNYNTANSQTDNSWVLYKDDRSYGSLNAYPIFPALNIGMGNACPNTSVTNAASRVPSGFAQWPYDILGNPRKNDGTGWAGAYEGSLCQ